MFVLFFASSTAVNTFCSFWYVLHTDEFVITTSSQLVSFFN